MHTNFGVSGQNRKSTVFLAAISIFFVLSLLWLMGPLVAYSQDDTATAAITANPATVVVPEDTVTPTETVTETDTPVPLADTPTLTDMSVPPTDMPKPEPTPTDTSAPPTDTSTPEPAPTDTPTPTNTPVPPMATATPTLSPFQKLFSSLQERPLQGGVCLIAVVLIVLVIWFLLRKFRQPPLLEEAPPPPTPPPVRPGVPYLESLSRPGSSMVFPLESLPVTIGRAQDNDLIIGNQYRGWETVSRHHAEIREDSGRYILNDNNSMNGVYVNGRRTGKNLLKDGFKVSFGQVEFIFRESSG